MSSSSASSPSRLGGLENSSVIFGYMFPSNSPTRYSTCASVMTLRTPSLRQSPVGKFRLLATHTSILSPTARSVKFASCAPPVLRLMMGQIFTVPTGGLSSAAAAAVAAVVSAGAAAGASFFFGFFTLTSWPR